MIALQAILLLLPAVGAVGDGASDTMGPASFWWPPDRTWSAETDNIGPCGSIANVGDRTEFPLTGGRIAFTAQDDSYNTQLSISFNSNPQSQSDFTPLTASSIPEIDPGHTCLSIPDQPASITPGVAATLQIVYTADFDRPENQTFYACADITFVAAAAFDPDTVPCFNATSPDDVPAPTATGTPTNVPGHGDDGPPLNTPGAVETEVVEGGGGGGLSAGGIAGAVVGSVVGVALVIGLGLLFYRERERKKRLVREREAGRTVKWVDGSTSTQGSRASQGGSVGSESIRMGNVGAQQA